MLSRVIAKNVGDVFLRHSVHLKLLNNIYFSVLTNITLALTKFTVLNE